MRFDELDGSRSAESATMFDSLLGSDCMSKCWGVDGPALAQIVHYCLIDRVLVDPAVLHNYQEVLCRIFDQLNIRDWIAVNQ
jgi:hypothetical protein